MPFVRKRIIDKQYYDRNTFDSLETANGQQRDGPNQGLNRQRDGPGKYHPNIGRNRDRSDSPRHRGDGKRRGGPNRDRPNRPGHNDRQRGGKRRPPSRDPHQRGNRD